MREVITTLPGWKGNISHKEAEKLLITKEPGTYLIRNGDPITATVEESLAEANKMDLDCYILTVVEEGQKIEDIMVIKVQDKWILYHDEPNLIDNSYERFDSIKDILQLLKNKAKYPL